MSLELRLGKLEDSNLLFELANDIDVRKNSFHNKRIQIEEHQNWYKNKLQDENSKIFIAEVNGITVGQIRIDITNSKALISYSICKDHRKKGYGTEILKVLESLVKKEFNTIFTLVGRVKYENIASQKVFERLDYTRLDKKEHIEYIKNIKALLK